MALENLSPHRRSGLWTPTLTIVSNLDVLTLVNAFFAISGNLVQCYLAATADPTAAGVYSFRAALPTGSRIADARDIIGVCSPETLAVFGGSVKADVASGEALISTDADAGVTVVDVYAHWAYRVR